MVPRDDVKMPSLINETFVGVNPAAFGMWYGMQNSEDWRLQLAVIYSVVVDGLGKQLVDQISFGIFQESSFSSGEAVRQSLWPFEDDVSVDQAKCDKIYADPYYGLNTPEGVDKWSVVCQDDMIGEAFINELFTYFGIRHKSLMDVMKHNFCS